MIKVTQFYFFNLVKLFYSKLITENNQKISFGAIKIMYMADQLVVDRKLQWPK